ncbi:hypothetical protein [Lusitaniella coriacea]
MSPVRFYRASRTCNCGMKKTSRAYPVRDPKTSVRLRAIAALRYFEKSYG